MSAVRESGTDPVAVMNLKHMLSYVEINPGLIDGIYGQLTKNAVLEYQNRFFDLTDDVIAIIRWHGGKKDAFI